MSSQDPFIRPIQLEDADEMARLHAQSAAYLRALGDDTDFQFNAHIYRRDGFGDNPAFSGFCAVLDNHLIGYLLYHWAYDTDRALRYLFVIDLLVDEEQRQSGIGKALMNHAAAFCQEAGGAELFWAVYDKNEAALNFYNRLGAEEINDLHFMRLKI
ncbi:MAG: GNAT family N-acetyltransferase [Ardenticatenaceae bacterium]|nr:GNAT family N-acetyltransferase [Ardenticatenaceae bacterium]